MTLTQDPSPAVVVRESPAVVTTQSSRSPTSSNVESRGDQLVRQFVQSLEENAFKWYTDLEPKVIHNWEQLENRFLSHFYSIRCTVSMMELTNTKQQKGELVIDYINRKRALRIKPRTFEELETRAHDIELSIASREAKDIPVPEPKLVHEEDKKFYGPQRLVTLADFFPTRFLCDHQDENPKVVACHAISTTEEESIPLRSLAEEGM
ncbi:ty3-gypsy retrotransposon protein [Cucumis melo var. makuwa]|uniref:Ty3-gypsy retrotransposon protein n=1 Tax=Cucumis melo var. makuwa TaxID=1194695 RepID=A0A5D3CGY1_CUCMM|nr:ty3-gypsy retrotransposon protein [Cucumis melo var. makuwa]